MITYGEIRRILENEMKDNWTNTPISWNNAPILIDVDEYVRFTINWFGGKNVTIGTDDTRKSGQINIQVFVERDTGSGPAVDYCDSLFAIFQNKQFGKIFTYAGDMVDIGEGVRRIKDVEYGYYQLNAIIPFEAQ